MSLFQRFKQRRFFQILVSYLAGGWIAVEVVDQLVDRGRLPDIAYTLVLIWYVAGIGAALLVAWYHGEKGRQRAPFSEMAALAIIAVTTILLTGSTVATYIANRAAVTAAEASRLDLHRVAVLYFEDLSPGGELTPVADGFTESLIDELSSVKGLDVLSRGAVQPYRTAAVAPERVGRALEAGTLVAGTVERLGDRVRLCLRLLDGESGIEFQRTSFDLPQADLLAARDTLAGRSARMLREWLGEEFRVRSTRGETSNLAAWLLYQRGEKARKDGEAALAERDLETMAARFDAADSLLADAQRADGAWTAPAVLRGHIAFRRSRVAASLDDLVHWVEVGLGRVAPALTVDPNDAKALEVRGTLKYWLWLQNVEPDPERSDALFNAARADLERAVELDPELASAHASLSHLYLNAPDEAAAVLAARRAYEEDAYLENADAVVWRLVTSSYNLEQFTEMARWCDIGRKRFPDNYRFVGGELQLMTTPAADPDVPRAWSLLATLDSLAPPYQAQFEHIRGEIEIGGVLARAGLADSARAVIARADHDLSPDLDPQRDLYRMEAYMLTLVGDYDRAIDLLKLDAALHTGSTFEQHWWWRELRSQPRWRELSR